MPREVSTRSRRKPRTSGFRKTSRALLPRRAKSLLILQCDAENLQRGGFSFSPRLEATVRVFAPAADVRLIRVNSQTDLQVGLAQALQEGGAYRVVAVEAHSNQQKLIVASDFHPAWEQFVPWLLPFQPTHVVLVGCQAARWLPVKAFFKGIPSLKEVYGSPVVTSESQVTALNFLATYLLANGRIPKDIWRTAQVFQFLANRGIIFSHRRGDFEKSGIEEGFAWTVIEEFLGRLRRQGRL